MIFVFFVTLLIGWYLWTTRDVAGIAMRSVMVRRNDDAQSRLYQNKQRKKKWAGTAHC